MNKKLFEALSHLNNREGVEKVDLSFKPGKNPLLRVLAKAGPDVRIVREVSDFVGPSYASIGFDRETTETTWLIKKDA